jgi:hypothetical protein
MGLKRDNLVVKKLELVLLWKNKSGGNHPQKNNG